MCYFGYIICLFSFFSALLHNYGTPKHSIVLTGEAYNKAGMKEEAEKWYKMSIQSKPDHVPAHLTLAKHYGKTVSYMKTRFDVYHLPDVTFSYFVLVSDSEVRKDIKNSKVARVECIWINTCIVTSFVT